MVSRRIGAAAPALIVAVVLLAVAALQVGPRHADLGAGRFWQARQAATDPLQLWSIEAVPQPVGWRAARLCTDTILRSGFAHGLPQFDGQDCRPVGDPISEPGRFALQCRLNGRRFGVSSTVEGDVSKDFVATFSISDLDVLGDGAAAFTQVRHYKRLGSCPPGWLVGDATDRNGVRRASVTRRLSPD